MRTANAGVSRSRNRQRKAPAGSLRRDYPLLAAELLLIEVPEDRWRALCERNRPGIRALESLAPGIGRYLGGWLHDGEILSSRYSRGDFALRVEDRFTESFFRALAQPLNVTLPQRRSAAAVELIFRGLRSLQVFRESTRQPLGATVVAAATASRKLRGTYLADEIHTVSKDEVRVGVLMAPPVRHLGSRWLLDIRARGMSLREFQRTAFVRAFGEDRLPVFEAWLALPVEEQAPVDYQQGYAERIVAELLRQSGID